MASNIRSNFVKVYLKDAETDRVYTINVTSEEATHLETGKCIFKCNIFSHCCEIFVGYEPFFS